MVEHIAIGLLVWFCIAIGAVLLYWSAFALREHTRKRRAAQLNSIKEKVRRGIR